VGFWMASWSNGRLAFANMPVGPEAPEPLKRGFENSLRWAERVLGLLLGGVFEGFLVFQEAWGEPV